MAMTAEGIREEVRDRDAELLLAWRDRRDREALAELFGRNAAVAWRVARLAGGSDEAEDAVQEGFLRVLTRAHCWRPTGSARAWLLAMVANAARDLARRRTRRQRRHAAVPPPEPPREEPDRELAAAVQAAVAELPPKLRQAVELRHVEQLSFAETAAVLGVGLRTAQSRVRLGLERMRTSLVRSGCVAGLSTLAGVLAAAPRSAVPASLLPAVRELARTAVLPTAGAAAAGGVGLKVAAAALAGAVGLGAGGWLLLSGPGPAPASVPAPDVVVADPPLAGELPTAEEALDAVLVTLDIDGDSCEMVCEGLAARLPAGVGLVISPVKAPGLGDLHLAVEDAPLRQVLDAMVAEAGIRWKLVRDEVVLVRPSPGEECDLPARQRAIYGDPLSLKEHVLAWCRGDQATATAGTFSGIVSPWTDVAGPLAFWHGDQDLVAAWEAAVRARREKWVAIDWRMPGLLGVAAAKPLLLEALALKDRPFRAHAVMAARGLELLAVDADVPALLAVAEDADAPAVLRSQVLLAAARGLARPASAHLERVRAVARTLLGHRDLAAAAARVAVWLADPGATAELRRLLTAGTWDEAPELPPGVGGAVLPGSPRSHPGLLVALMKLDPVVGPAEVLKLAGGDAAHPWSAWTRVRVPDKGPQLVMTALEHPERFVQPGGMFPTPEWGYIPWAKAVAAQGSPATITTVEEALRREGSPIPALLHARALLRHDAAAVIIPYTTPPKPGQPRPPEVRTAAVRALGECWYDGMARERLKWLALRGEDDAGLRTEAIRQLLHSRRDGSFAGELATFAAKLLAEGDLVARRAVLDVRRYATDPAWVRAVADRCGVEEDPGLQHVLALAVAKIANAEGEHRRRALAGLCVLRSHGDQETKVTATKHLYAWRKFHGKKERELAAKVDAAQGAAEGAGERGAAYAAALAALE